MHVLVEAQLAAGAQDPAQLGQCGGLVGHAAQHEAGDGGVAACVRHGQGAGDRVADATGTGARVAARRAKARRYGSGSTATTSRTAGG